MELSIKRSEGQLIINALVWQNQNGDWLRCEARLPIGDYTLTQLEQAVLQHIQRNLTAHLAAYKNADGGAP